MVGEAGDRDFPLLDPDDPLDDADVDLAGVEDATLLDVQLEVGGNLPLTSLDQIELRRISAEERDPLLDCLAAARHVLQFGGDELSTQRAAPVQSALFVLPDRDLDRVSRRQVVLG